MKRNICVYTALPPDLVARAVALSGETREDFTWSRFLRRLVRDYVAREEAKADTAAARLARAAKNL